MTEKKEEVSANEAQPSRPLRKFAIKGAIFIIGALLSFIILLNTVGNTEPENHIAHFVGVIAVGMFFIFDKKKRSFGLGIISGMAFYFILLSA